uniref:Pantothenate transporter n=1 Tax=Colletotrichum fructicola (strain Nara gc5) TaxID=1213859 RepID=L2FDV6_COLFN
MGVPDNLNIQVAANDVDARDATAIGQSSGSDGGITPVESEPKDYIDPKEERAFVWRLDLFFLTIGFLGYMFKYIDQTNISNAYVSGMKEDLSLFGNELNYFTTFFKQATDACQVYGLRFLIGLFEGTAWPGYFTLISQWYMPHEVALRMSLYNIAQPAGAMLSGAMQGALSTNFEGVAGRSGWRWAFIINGACTIVVALAAFFILPGYPERPNPLSKFYMTDRHIEIAVARGRRVGRKPQIGITVKSFLRCFTFWQLWAIAIAWPVGGNFTPASYFNLWLKSLKNSDGTVKYSVAMLNYLPIAGQGLQLISELLFSGFSGYFGVHLPFLLLHSAINIASQVILIVRPKNEGAYMAGWYMNYIGAVSTMLLCSWGSAHLQHEPEVRTVLFASGTVLAYIMSAFIPIAAFPASEAPNWRIGSKLYLAFALVAVVIFIGIHFGFKWEEKKQQKEAVKEELASEPDDANAGVKTPTTNATASAISSVVPALGTGNPSIIALIPSPLPPAISSLNIFVSVHPGLTQFTRTPLPAPLVRPSHLPHLVILQQPPQRRQRKMPLQRVGHRRARAILPTQTKLLPLGISTSPPKAAITFAVPSTSTS